VIHLQTNEKLFNGVDDIQSFTIMTDVLLILIS